MFSIKIVKIALILGGVNYRTSGMLKFDKF